MPSVINELKRQLNEAIQTKGDWKTPYFRLMEAVYDMPVLFVALSRDDFRPDTHLSKPLISTKDFEGAPTVYLFSDLEIATEWMRHYRHVTQDLKFGLVGALPKEENDFLNFFQIAAKLGIKNLLLDEGGSMVGLKTEQFLAVNEINADDIQLRVTKEELASLRKQGDTPMLHFAEMAALPLTINEDAAEQ